MIVKFVIWKEFSDEIFKNWKIYRQIIIEFNNLTIIRMKQVSGSGKVSGFKKSDIFLKIRGDLAVRKYNKPHKFCKDCCLMFEAIQSKLKTHYNGHHKGLEPQWLKYDEVPVRCVY